MKLYTLQECFEALGSKFPFKVSWNSSRHQNIICEYIIVDKQKDICGAYIWEFLYTDRSEYPQDSPMFFGSLLAEEKHFDYKILQYKQEFDNIINDKEIS